MIAGLGRLLTHPLTVRTCQLLLGLILGVAGMAKLGNIPALAEEVHNFRIVPIATENLLAMTLPWIELAAGLALILGIRRRSAAITGATLMAFFTVAVIQAIARGLDFECGCFGTADATQVGVWKLAENLAMTAIAVVATLKPR